MKADEIKKISTRTIRLILLTIIVMLCTSCSVIQEEQPAKGTNIPISNVPQAAQSNKYNAVLYYGYRDQEMLTDEMRAIDVPSNERVEMAILRELIKGPTSTNDELVPVINPKTTVVYVKDSGTILLVTLSKEFLLPFGDEPQDYAVLPDWAPAVQRRLRLAIDSIVNSLTEIGQFAQVQIFIDMDGTGNGQRIKRKDVGLDTDTGNAAGDQPLEPLMRQDDVILTPQKTVSVVMDLLKDRNYPDAYKYISFSGDNPPTPDELAQTINASQRVLDDYKITGESVSADGTGAVVTTDITVREKNVDSSTMPSIPVRLVRVKECWKISTLALHHIFLIF